MKRKKQLLTYYTIWYPRFNCIGYGTYYLDRILRYPLVKVENVLKAKDE